MLISKTYKGMPPGIKLDSIDGKVIVTSINEYKIPPHSIVKFINGTDLYAKQMQEQACKDLIKNSESVVTTLKYRTPDVIFFLKV